MNTQHYNQLTDSEKNAFYYVSNIQPHAVPWSLYLKIRKICDGDTAEDFRGLIKELVIEWVGKLGYMLDKMGEDCFDAIMVCDEENEREEMAANCQAVTY